MSQLTTAFIESYVLAENKEESLKSLTPYTENFYYVEIVGLLQQKAQSAELEAKIEAFLSNPRYSSKSKNYIRLSHITLKMETANDGERKALMEEMNKNFLNYEFNHQKPYVTQTDGGMNFEDDEQLADSINDNQAKNLNIHTYVEALYASKSLEDLNKIDHRYHYLIDIHKFDPVSNLDIVDQILRYAPRIHEIRDIVGFLKLAVEKNSTNGLYRDEVFCKLTLAQQSELINLGYFLNDKNAVEQFVSKKFRLTEINMSGDEDNTKTIEDFLAFSRGLPPKYEQLISINLALLLIKKLKNNEFDEVLFNEYLQKPYQTDGMNFKHDHLQKLDTKNQKNKLEQIYVPNYEVHVNFATDYINHFINSKESVEKYSAYFDRKYLENIYFTNALMRGGKIDNINSALNEDDLQRISSSKTLDLQNNKHSFAHGQKVNIGVAIKNIRELSVRVFEVSSENYIKTNNHQDYSSIDLNGLIPFEEYKYTYNHQSIIKHEEMFNFLSIEDAKRGVFIIHFTGEELNSTAVIQKGHLTLINDALSGHVCKILDEENNICVSSRTGIFIKGKYFGADPTTGVINLPRNLDIEGSSQVVIVHEGFADLATLTLYNDEYQLNINLLYNPESFITGNEVELVLQTKLSRNSHLLSLNHLKNVDIAIKVHSDSGIVTKIPLRDFALSDTADLPIKFILPNKSVSLEVSVRGSVKKGNKEIELSNSQYLTFHKENIHQIFDIFIKKNENKEFIIEVLGNNGEPMRNKALNISAKVQHLVTAVEFKLRTNQQGRVNLGQLKGVENVTIFADPVVLYHNISYEIDHQYPSMIKLVEAEAYSLPLSGDNKKVSLQRYVNGNYFEVLGEENITVVNNTIEIRNLKKGEYHIVLDNETIPVSVHKGDRRQLNGDNLITKNSIQLLRKNQTELAAQISYDENEVTASLNAALSHAKVHLMTLNYDFTNKHAFLEKQKSFNNTVGIVHEPEYSINKKDNIYRSEARLDDEVIYVYERKNKAEFLGNTLDKPGIILKRNRLGETTEGTEQLQQAQSYNRAKDCKMNYCGNYDQQYMSQKCYGDGFFKQTSPIKNVDLVSIEFLANPGKLHPNLTIQNGQVKIDKKLLNNYSLSYLVISDGNKNILVEIDSRDVEAAKKDTRLSESKPKGFTYSYDRKIKFVASGDKNIINNINNTEMCLLSSLRNIYDIFGLSNPSLTTSLNEWSFIVDWANLSDMEKLKKYDKYACHELNLMLYMKDREFFDGVIRGFLSNKVEKQLVDYYVLGDIPALQRFASIEKIGSLNNVERILLLSALKDVNAKFCDALVDFMRNWAQKYNITAEKRKQVFDTVLTSQKDNDANRDDLDANPVLVKCSVPILRAYCAAPKMNASLKNKKCKKEKRQYSSEECEDEEEYIDFEADLFAGMQSTIEYNEKQYFNSSSIPNTTVTKFWLNLASHISKTKSFNNFFDAEFIYDENNISEALFIVSFVDLPFNGTSAKSQLVGSDLSISSKNNFVILSKEIIQKQGEVQKLDVLVAQRFIDMQDPVVFEEHDDGLREYEKEVNEYIKGKIYNSRIVVTNSTTTSLNLNILREIPQGSLPVSNRDYFKIENMVIESFSTKLVEFDFYFPNAGNFTVYPATVICDGKIVSTANIAETIVVKDIKETKNLDNIADILTSGNFDDILNFLKTKNLFNDLVFNFEHIYWLLKNKSLHTQIINVLRERGAFDSTVWSYSILHGDLHIFRELLSHDSKARLVNIYSEIEYLKNSIVEIENFDLREYYPLVNPRAHAVNNNKANILNKSFEQRYTKFLNYLFQKGSVSLEDRIVLTNYLICQERIQEAIQVFKTLEGKEADSVISRLQLDYLRAYIDFISGYPNFTVAKSICAEYLSYPVLSWRNLFIEIANQLAEFEEKELIENLIESKQKTNMQKAQSASNFKCEVVYNQTQPNCININYERINQLQIKYYKVDLEVLFSLKPFEEKNSKNFCTLLPFHQETVQLNSDRDFNSHLHQIPLNIQHESIYIELVYNVNNNSKSEYLEYVPFKLNYNLNTEFGIIKLVDPVEKRPVPKVYVKCFAMYSTGPKFYKDGYTDLRGSFDYVSLNTDKLTDINKFAVFITSKTHGSKIIHCEPPVKLGRVEGEAKKLVSAQWETVRAEKSKGGPQQQKNRYAYVI